MKLSTAIAIMASTSQLPALAIVELVEQSTLRGAARQSTADAAMLELLTMEDE